MVFDVAGAVDIPVIGMGGVSQPGDVLDFLACGASAVAVGAAGFRDPWIYRALAEGLQAELRRRSLTLEAVIGVAHAPHN
jgi:dihydroorotate dehydrogenase (NAD+) catalytic subunit